MSLFEHGQFVLSSGQQSDFRINCQHLTPASWDAVARKLPADLVQGAYIIVPIPRGGVPFAEAIKQVKGAGPDVVGGHVLVVDDVLTTAGSMENMRLRYDGEPVRGVVLFARGPCPPWIHAVWQWGL